MLGCEGLGATASTWSGFCNVLVEAARESLDTTESKRHPQPHNTGGETLPSEDGILQPIAPAGFRAVVTRKVFNVQGHAEGEFVEFHRIGGSTPAGAFRFLAQGATARKQDTTPIEFTALPQPNPQRRPGSHIPEEFMTETE